MTDMLEIKRHDRHPIQMTVNADITGATSAKMLAQPRVKDGVTVELAATIEDPATGRLLHVLDGQLDDHEWWQVEAEVTAGSTIRTAPGGGYLLIHVVPDLG